LSTGKKTIGISRKSLKNKVSVTKIVKNSHGWQETMLQTAYSYYDLSNTKQIMVGDDGNRWVCQNFDMVGLLIEIARDRYHLCREARCTFSFIKQTENWARHIC
jgi:trans-2-enoyl-CoA reductase